MKVNRNQFSENPSQVTCKGNNVTLLNARHCRFLSRHKGSWCFIFIFEVKVVHKVHQGGDSMLTVVTCQWLVNSKTAVFIVFAFSSSKR